MRLHLLPLCLVLFLPIACTRAPQPTTGPPQERASPQPPHAEQGRAPRARPRAGSPGDFDFFLLTLSWSPEFCATHATAAECATHAGFVLHGLWPQNTDSTYPEHCSDASGPADPSQYSDIFPDAGLLQHEWSTHGTCSGLAPDAYFQLARRAFQGLHTPPALNALTQQTSETPDAILGQFTSINPGIPASSLALSCGNNYLTAVQVCLSKDLSAIACNVRSCRANIVRIVPRGSAGPS